MIDGGTEGIGLIPVMEAYRRVIVVDAVPMDEPPGTIRRFTWQDVRFIGHERTLSLHQSDLTDALLLAEALNCLPQTLVIYGVQPHNMGWDQSVKSRGSARFTGFGRDPDRRSQERHSNGKENSDY